MAKSTLVDHERRAVRAFRGSVREYGNCNGCPTARRVLVINLRSTQVRICDACLEEASLKRKRG